MITSGKRPSRTTAVRTGAAITPLAAPDAIPPARASQPPPRVASWSKPHGTDDADDADDAGQCVIERLILHQTDQEQPGPLLVAAPARLDAPGAAWFAAYVAEAERRADWHARLADPEGEMSRTCAALLDTPEAFVLASQALARRLHTQMRARPRQIARGDFVALVYRRGGERAIALLKLDPDQHRFARRFEGPPGGRRVRIQVAAGLLPDARALQKCALIAPAPPDDALIDGAPFAIRLLDTQAGPRSEGVAAYFYRGFLGAELLPSARRLTRCFLAATETWLGAHAASLPLTEVLAFYQARRHALAGTQIDVAAFAREALPTRPALVPNLIAALSQACAAWGMREAVMAIPVDPAIAAPLVRTVTLVLDGNARLTVPVEAFSQLVKSVARGADGKVRLVLETLTLSEGSGA